VLKTTLKEDEYNKYLLIEKEETITITVTRGLSSVIDAISLGTIALNVKGKLLDVHEQLNYTKENTTIKGSPALFIQNGIGENQENV
jgi:hypothetical protein